MNRREFLRRASIIAAGAIAADQMDLLERLAPRRLYFQGADFARQDAYEGVIRTFWKLECSPRNRALLSGLSAETRARIPAIWPDRRPIQGRRLVVPVRIAEGFDEVTYVRELNAPFDLDTLDT